MTRFPRSAAVIALVAGVIATATTATTDSTAVTTTGPRHNRPHPANGRSAPLRFRVSVMGMSGSGLGWRLRRIGIEWDRVDVADGSDIGKVRYALRQDVKCLVLFNPGLDGLSPQTAALEVRRLALEILPLGLHEIEFGNEVYDHGSTPRSYAAQYAAAHAAVAGLHITLIADSFGDYERPNATWSQDSSGGGWIHDFIHALPADGREIDAFSIHPYGPMNRLGSGEDGGWPTVGRYHALALANHVDVPWYVTEVGQNLGDSDTSPPVDPGMQAADITRYLNDTLSKYRWVSYLDFYAIKDNASGRWGLLNSNDSPRRAYRALAKWMAAHRRAGRTG